MSRRVKHTPEQKVKIVRAVLEGHDSKEGIARQYGISTGRIHEWIMQYKVNGIAAFISKCQNKVYNEATRKSAVEEYLKGKVILYNKS